MFSVLCPCKIYDPPDFIFKYVRMVVESPDAMLVKSIYPWTRPILVISLIVCSDPEAASVPEPSTFNRGGVNNGIE